ncbi:MAG: MFS transporter [Armatimonadota bacterium]|nr:MFS transporter [Armatimonadota bacterium]
MSVGVEREGRLQTFRAFRHRNFRLWFLGQTVSLFGTWMQATAQGFLVYQLTRSPAYLGYVAFSAGIPSWLLMLYGGAVADRMPRRTLLLVTQASMMVLAFLLAGLTFGGIVKPWHIVALAFALGIANAFDAPARQAFVWELVDLEDLTNAVALNAVMFNTATVVGPAAAGIVYASLGPGWCFVFNGISFLAVIAALLFMEIQRRGDLGQGTSTPSGISEGIRYVASHPVIRTVVLLVTSVSVFGWSLISLMPAWAVDVLHGDAQTNGLLQAARGLGALVGALTLATLSQQLPRGRALILGSLLYPLLMLAFAWVWWLPGSFLLLAAIGTSTIFVVNLSNALVQSLVPDRIRGRVMGVYSLTFLGGMPLGSLLLGIVARLLGVPKAITTSALISLAVGIVLLAFHPSIQDIQ